MMLTSKSVYKKEKLMTSKSHSNPKKTSDLSSESGQHPLESFIIVGIGASAGGLEAFTQLLQNLGSDTGMGFVLIQHLAPDHDSQLSEILQHSTQMPVNEASDGMKIAPNAVYVIPPNTLMTLEQGILKLQSRQLVKGRYMAINGFFSSLAADRGNLAIAIVLSGSNEDGAEGLGVIKSAGGITFAQDLTTAEFPTMPRIAIASENVDFVLSPAGIGAKLINISLGKHPQHPLINAANNAANNSDIYLNEPDDQSATISIESEELLTIIFTLLHDLMGVDFSHYKKGTIKRRIARRMGLLNLQELDVYTQYLRDHPDEVEKLYHDILINVTSFFREPESFSALQQIVFPAICENKAQDVPIRIWVVGCSSGEEVYSIAISLLEFFDDYDVKHPIQIFATDISEIVIAKARLGVYTESSLAGVSPARLQRFFNPVKGGHQIGKLVRESCIFAHQNLTNDPPFSRLDMISCRNMLIYLEPVLQKKVMPIFHYALNSNGFLILGNSEGIGKAGDLFTIADKKNRIFKRTLTPPRMNFNFVRSTYVRESLNPANYNQPSEEMNLEEIADQIVLSQYAPVGVLIDSDLEILQFRGQTSFYLEPSPGKASLNLLKMARSDLKLELRSAIHDAQQQNIPIAKDNIKMQQNTLVKIDVIPLHDPNNDHSDRYFLVLFENRPNPTLPTPVASSITKTRKVRQTEAEMQVIQLTHELQKNKEYLRSIIETQEASNQDLKVSGEELLSSNEELQSANEELETAKEEIQATNEELNTVNDEMRDRNVQLTDINNDLQNLLSSINIPILMLSGDLRIRRFTPMAEQSFNLIASDVGRPFSDIQTNIDVVHIRTLVTSVIDTLIPYEQDVQDRSGDWYSLRIRPYRTIENKIDGVIISLIDIDLLKRNAIQLEASGQYVTTIIETLRQPIVVLNSNLQVMMANKAFYQIFQLKSNQTNQQSIFALGQDKGKADWNIPALRSLLNDILIHDITVQNYEVSQKFSLLGDRTLLLNACQIEQVNTGKMILLAIDDITERKLQKQQLITKNQDLSEAIIASESANRSKSKFLGNMSHELRTPLNSIMGFSQLLKSVPNLDDEARQYLEIIYQSGKHLLSLIQDLLDISRIEAEKMAIEPNILCLPNFLQLTVEILQSKVLDKKLTFTTQFATDLPPSIYADEKRLRQILLNLLTNALKFTSAGEITLTVSKNLDGLIRFEVADTGVGILAAEIEKIFLPFEQVGEANIKTEGTGLGLAISQNLVEMMGGEIKVVSEIGVGSTFSFELNLSIPSD